MSGFSGRNTDWINRSEQVVDYHKSERKFFTNVFGYMMIGVFITAVVTMIISNNQGMMESLFSTYEYTNSDGEAATGFTASAVWWACSIAELVLVVVICYLTSSLKGITSMVLFLVYAALNGVTIAPMIYAYTGASVATVFFISSAVFAVAAAFGFMTKMDLTNLGSFFMIGLISLVIAMVVNIVIGSPMIDYVISAAAVLLFTGLTAYDVQMLSDMHRQQHNGGENLVIYGALSLYLDFINLFIHLLRILGTSDD